MHACPYQSTTYSRQTDFFFSLLITLQIDESKFGKRKDNRGRWAKGMWVLGIISEEDRGRIIPVPIADREANTILPIVRRAGHHYQDGWSRVLSAPAV